MKKLLISALVPLLLITAGAGYAADQTAEGQADFFRKVWALGTAGVKVPLSILRGTKIQDITLQSADRYQFIKRGPEVDGKRETL